MKCRPIASKNNAVKGRLTFHQLVYKAWDLLCTTVVKSKFDMPRKGFVRGMVDFKSHPSFITCYLLTSNDAALMQCAAQ